MPNKRKKKKPIEVTDPNHKGLLAYNDSLSAYNKQQDVIDNIIRTGKMNVKGDVFDVDVNDRKLRGGRSRADKVFNRSHEDWVRGILPNSGVYNSGTSKVMYPEDIMDFPRKE